MKSVISESASEDESRRARSTARLASAIAKAEAALGQPYPPVARPVLVVFSGLPASGKSFLARQLQPHLCAIIIETDHVRRLLFRSPRYTPSENAWVYTVCHHLIARRLQVGHQVIFDATNLVERYREMIYAIADEQHVAMVIVHTVAPEEIVRQRMERRKQQIDRHDKSDADMAVYAMLRQTEQPICRPHLVIDTTEDSAASVRRILRTCAQVLS